MLVVGLQLDLVWEDPEANRARLAERLPAAAEHVRGGLIVLPEMWPTGFTMDASLAEPEGGPSETFLVEQAAAIETAICGTVAQTRLGSQRRQGAQGRPSAQRRGSAPRPHNVFLLAEPGGAVHRYSKIHPFAHGGEAEIYDAGDALLTVQVDDARVTPLVCYDLRFAELFTIAAPRTDLFVIVANWPVQRIAHWRALLIARAIEAQCFVLGVNRVGEGGGLTYSGGSMMVSPLGEVLGELPPGSEGAVAWDLDPAEVADVRARLPFLPDRRPELYRRLSDGN